MDFWVIRDGMSLKAYGPESGAIIDKLKLGKAVYVTARQPRNERHFRLFWTLCSRIADGFGCEREDIAHILKVRTGHVRLIQTPKGVEEIPKSISFAEMSQEEFGKFFDKCLVVITEHLGIAR